MATCRNCEQANACTAGCEELPKASTKLRKSLMADRRSARGRLSPRHGEPDTPERSASSGGARSSSPTAAGVRRAGRTEATVDQDPRATDEDEQNCGTFVRAASPIPSPHDIRVDDASYRATGPAWANADPHPAPLDRVCRRDKTRLACLLAPASC